MHTQNLMVHTETMFDDVGRFHIKFCLPIAHTCLMPLSFIDESLTLSASPVRHNSAMRADEAKYRIDFLEEELKEFKEGVLSGDLEQQADALADIVWVALGTAHHLGIDFDAVWNEVKRANMAKERAPDDDSIHKRGAAERIRKPEDWVPPDIEGALWPMSKSSTIRGGEL